MRVRTDVKGRFSGTVLPMEVLTQVSQHAIPPVCRREHAHSISSRGMSTGAGLTYMLDIASGVSNPTGYAAVMPGCAGMIRVLVMNTALEATVQV